MRMFSKFLAAVISLLVLAEAGLALTIPAGTYRSRFANLGDGVKTRYTLEIVDGQRLVLTPLIVIQHPLSGESMSTEFSWHMNYVIGADLGNGIFALDNTIVSAAETPLSQSFVSQYNDDNYCGYSDWEIGVPKDVTGRQCDEDDEPINAGDIDYNIIKYDNGTVWLGFYPQDDDLTGTTPANRPTELDTQHEMRSVAP
jgi:hypothetical protein